MKSHTTAERQRAWRALNPNKVAEYKRRWWAKIKAARPPKIAKPYKFKNRESDYGREWRAQNPEKIAARRLRERQRREARYAAEAGRPKPEVCDICAKKIGNIVYDHCHTYGHFRGFLCDGCNTVLGLMEDDANLLVAMSAYLMRTRTNISPQFTLPGL